MTGKENVLKERLIEFSFKVLNVVKSLPKNTENNVYGMQVIRSSSSVGANYSEAIFAHSKVDFIHCMVICRKEISETLYWLELLKRANPKYRNSIDFCIEESTSILKIFIASVKTARTNQ